jgi:hypothetical protein
MNYIGYDFSLTEEGIGLDNELNLDRLGWKGGDYFKLVNLDGKAKLIKVDALEKFLNDGAKK